MNQYEVFIRDENGDRVSQLEDFTNLTFIRRFNSIGSWTLTSNPSALAGLTKKGGLEVFRNGKPHFSGIVRRFQDDDGLVLIAGGADDLKVLSAELALPDPAGAPYSIEYDVRSDVAETVVKQFVELNLGPSAISARRIPGLTVETDYGRGSLVTGRARFETVFELVNSLAIQGGIGFRIKNLEFQVFVPEDKSGTILFSKELGTLGKYSFTVEAGASNYLFCGGSGEGAVRTIVEGSDPASILSWGRTEAFLDKGNASSLEELNAAMEEDLVKNSEKASLVFSPIVSESMKPVDDYDVGDMVSSVISGITMVHRVREMKTTLDGQGGETVEIAIGTEGASSDLSRLSNIYSRMRGIDQRVSTYERR